MKPIIVINFKTYKQGKNAVKLAKQLSKISKNIIIGVQASDINEIKKTVSIKVFSQHADWQKKGRATGFILPEAIKTDKADGTFLNHSEHKLPFNIIKKTIARCKKLKLKTIVFAKDLKEAKKIKKLKPTYIVFEPPELVAGRISVSEAKPEIIKNISKKLKSKFLVGAGIHSKEDVKTAIKLGASGIAVSSAVVLSKNPEKVLKELIK